MKFIVYSKPGCTYCDKIVQVLTLTEQKFVEYKLGSFQVYILQTFVQLV